MNGDQNEFLKKLSSLREDAALQGGYLTEEEIEEAFPALSKDQKELLCNYFKENNIGIGEPLPDSDLLDDRDYSHLEMYLDELDELEELDADLKRVLVMNALNGDRTARERVLNSYLKNVVDIAKLYAGQGAEVSDLIGEGNIALTAAISLMESIETPEDLDQMVVRSVMNAMEEVVGKEYDETELKQKMLLKVIRVGNRAQSLSKELKRKVSVAELVGDAEEEDPLTEEDILEALRITGDLKEYIAV